jgi:hypothetical protein
MYESNKIELGEVRRIPAFQTLRKKENSSFSNVKKKEENSSFSNVKKKYFLRSLCSLEC